MDDSQRRDILNVMVFAASDGKVSDAEREFIRRMTEELGIEAEEFNELLEEVRQNPKRLSLPKDPDQAEATLAMLTRLAVSDGDISASERHGLYRVASLLHLDTKTVERLLAAAMGQEVDDAELDSRAEAIYRHFHEWDAATRQQKLDELAKLGYPAVPAMIRLLESYRVPDGAENAKELKTAVAIKLGELRDDRAVYYLAQHASLGYGEDLTGPQLRRAAAEAVGRIVGQDFSADPDGIEAMRRWWASAEQDRYQPTAY